MPIYASSPEFDAVFSEFQAASIAVNAATTALSVGLLSSSQDKKLLFKLTEDLERANAKQMDLYAEMQKHAIDE